MQPVALPEDGVSTFLRNVRIQSVHYTTQRPIKKRLLASPPWKPEIQREVSLLTLVSATPSLNEP